MIDLRLKNQDELETFVRKIKKGGYNKGVSIAYHEGNYGDGVGNTILGKLMWMLHERGLVDLVQKKIGFERFIYMGQVR